MTEIKWKLDSAYIQQIEDALLTQGYHLGRRLGGGYARDVFEVTCYRNDLCKKYVAKIHRGARGDSIQHQINLTQPSIKEKEVIISNSLSHESISKIHDSFVKDGVDVLIEDYVDAVSLDDLLKEGPMNEGFVIDLISQTQQALRYLHLDQEILHRDIKPSNILLCRQSDLVKLTDFQNAGYSEMRVERLPIRGGSPYTHPWLLNSLVLGRPNRVSVTTEFYALGITLFQLLTGEHPFDYQIVQDEQGTALVVGDQKHIMSLLVDGQRVNFINPSQHNRRVYDTLKKVPRAYHTILRDCLSVFGAYTNVSPTQAHDRFEKMVRMITPPPAPIIDTAWLGRDQDLNRAFHEMVGITRRHGTRKKRDTHCRHNTYTHAELPPTRIYHLNTREMYDLQQARMRFILDETYTLCTMDDDNPHSFENRAASFSVFREGTHVLLATSSPSTRIVTKNGGSVLLSKKWTCIPPNMVRLLGSR